MSKTKFEIFTDTAVICAFDNSLLKHRLSDDADWWTLEDDLLDEINCGNLSFVGVGSDGGYLIEVELDASSNEGESFYLRVPTGQLFIGPGEEITGANFDYDNRRITVGKVIKVPKGCVEITYIRTSEAIKVHVIPSDICTNNFDDEVSI